MLLENKQKQIEIYDKMYIKIIFLNFKIMYLFFSIASVRQTHLPQSVTSFFLPPLKDSSDFSRIQGLTAAFTWLCEVYWLPLRSALSIRIKSTRHKIGASRRVWNRLKQGFVETLQLRADVCRGVHPSCLVMKPTCSLDVGIWFAIHFWENRPSF